MLACEDECKTAKRNTFAFKLSKGYEFSCVAFDIQLKRRSTVDEVGGGYVWDT